MEGCRLALMIGPLRIYRRDDLYHSTPAVTWDLSFHGLILGLNSIYSRKHLYALSYIATSIKGAEYN
jgi:hypothetical protein